MLDGGNQVPPALEAFLKGGKGARQALTEHGHQKPNAAALIGRELGQPVEATAQLVDTVVQPALRLGAEGNGHVFRSPARQSLNQTPLLIGPQGRSRGAKHVYRQRRLPGQIGRHRLGLVAPALLDECLVEAVQQLNADPYVKVWGAFTQTWRITPMELAVTFLELDVPESYRANRPHRILPQAVLVGLAERAISTAAANLAEYEIEVLTSKARSSKGESSARATVEGKLIQLAMEEMKALVASEEADVVLAASPEHSEFEREIERQVQKVRVPEKRIGRRFYEAKVQAGEGTLRQVRSIGTSSLLMVGLSTEQRLQATRNWERE
jgi:hypothetical protein